MRKTTRLISLFGLLYLLLLHICCPAYADTATDLLEDYPAAGVPIQDQEEAAAPSGVHGLIGAGLFNLEKTLGESGHWTELLPIVILTYEDRAYLINSRGGVWLLRSDDRSLKLGAGMRVHYGWKPGDDLVLSGMAKRHASVDGTLDVLWKTSIVNVWVSYYRDIGHVSDGEAADVRLNRSLWLTPQFRLIPGVGVLWQSERYVNYYYGVRPNEATPGRPAYVGHDTVNYIASVVGEYLISRDWSLLGGILATHFGDGIADSPIVSHRGAISAFFGAGWRF